jgi:cellulase/cellobiase CelA1
VAVSNPTAAPITWTVVVSVNGTVYNHWNSDVSQTGTSATFRGQAWNASLAAGGQLDFGFCANR